MQRERAQLPTDIQTAYTQFKNYQIQKLQIESPKFHDDIQKLSIEEKKMYRIEGEEVLEKSQKRMGVLIFAGGMGNRADVQDGKQFRTFGRSTSLRGSIENPGCLFDLVLKQTLGKIILNKWDAVIYVLCNIANRNNILDHIEHIQQIIYVRGQQKTPIYICFQEESPILDSSGFQEVYIEQGSQTNFTYPNGTGKFLDASIYFNRDEKITLLNHLQKITRLDYLYGVGISNLEERGIDPLLIGYLQKHPQDDLVFKCVEAEFLDEPYYRAAIRLLPRNKKQWIVMQFCNLASISDRVESAKKAPVWCDNFLVRVEKLIVSYKQLKKEDLKYEFHERQMKDKNNQILPVKIAECLISSAVMNEKMKCKGILQKHKKFKPLITPHDFQNAEEIIQSNKSLFFVKK